MKFAVLSDTHGQHKQVKIPNVDCLIHCGDISSMGTFSQVCDFMEWFIGINAPVKIFVAGNHDFYLDGEYMSFINTWGNALEKGNVVYLDDSPYHINGITIHGSPMSPRFGRWAFMADRGEAIKKHWDKIPDNTDILITHSPAHGILDRTSGGDLAGCQDLLNRINEVKPKYHLFGHIHEGRGWINKEGVNHINATCLDENYKFKYQPFEFDYEKTDNHT